MNEKIEQYPASIMPFGFMQKAPRSPKKKYLGKGSYISSKKKKKEEKNAENINKK